MANTTSSQGQLQRAGIRVAPTQRRKRKKEAKMLRPKRHRLHECRLREMSSRAFLEPGADEQDAKQPKKKSRVYLVTIIEEGLGNSKDKNYYSGDALKGAVKLFDGAKAFCDHPDAISEKTLPERSMKDLVGWYTDCYVDARPDTGKARLRGKLHFFPTASWLTGMIDTILTDPTSKDMFGISINAVGKTRPAEMNGEVVNLVEEFQRVDSADVVTEPAARGKFEKILESKRGARKVTTSMKGKRVRESGALTSEQIKEVADGLTRGYFSEDPDEMKTAIHEAATKLYSASSISGKGPGQVNEEKYTNAPAPIADAGGKGDMNKLNRKQLLKASGRFGKKKKALRAAAGTGPDNETLPEPSPEDIEPITEADVEDEETQELGDFDDFGDASKKVRASRGKAARIKAAKLRRTVAESLEDEDEDEDEQLAPPTDQLSRPAASAALSSAEEDEDEDEQDDLGGGDEEMGGGEDLGGGEPDEMGDEDMEPEGLEAEAEAEEDEDEAEEDDEGEALEMCKASGKKRKLHAARRRSQEASGFYGKAGDAALPSHAIGDYTDDFKTPSRDTSTSGVGKSYKLKTSIAGQNKLARGVVKEANRRIEKLEGELVRLRESNRNRQRKIDRYVGMVGFHNTKVEAQKLLREAVKRDLFPVGYARTLEPKLYGMKRGEQIQEIKLHARLLESASDSVVHRFREADADSEGVEGAPGRGTAVSQFGTSGGHSDLAEGLAADGVPMRQRR